MKATVEYVEKKFDEFNQLCFNGSLPRVKVAMSDARTFLGKYTWRCRHDAQGSEIHYDRQLRVNTRLDMEESLLEDVILHEMIHYYIEWNQLHDTSAHGPIFRRIMDEINTRYGRHITVTHKGTSEQHEQLQDNRLRWHVVAIVRFDDGKVGLKVLPRIAQHIVRYYEAFVHYQGVTQVLFFLTNNPYFNRYPTSSVLRAHWVDGPEVEKQLSGAKVVECDGQTVRVVS